MRDSIPTVQFRVYPILEMLKVVQIFVGCLQINHPEGCIPDFCSIRVVAENMFLVFLNSVGI